MLLSMGITVNAVDSKGNTPLYDAIKHAYGNQVSAKKEARVTARAAAKESEKGGATSIFKGLFSRGKKVRVRPGRDWDLRSLKIEFVSRI